jgi:hypothetical protein
VEAPEVVDPLEVVGATVEAVGPLTPEDLLVVEVVTEMTVGATKAEITAILWNGVIEGTAAAPGAEVGAPEVTLMGAVEAADPVATLKGAAAILIGSLTN